MSTPKWLIEDIDRLNRFPLSNSTREELAKFLSNFTQESLTRALPQVRIHLMQEAIRIRILPKPNEIRQRLEKEMAQYLANLPTKVNLILQEIALIMRQARNFSLSLSFDILLDFEPSKWPGDFPYKVYSATFKLLRPHLEALGYRVGTDSDLRSDDRLQISF